MIIATAAKVLSGIPEEVWRWEVMGGDGRGVGERRWWRKDGGLSKGEEVREGESGKVRDREGEVG